MTDKIREYRTIKLREGLVNSVEKFLKTKKARDLGLVSIVDVIDYYTKKGMESNL